MTGDSKKIKVLIVEDSPVVQLLLSHLLNSEPCLQVIGTSANGQEALEFISREKPDVVLMDIHMPVMDGFEATRKIMASRPVPIVISSASTRTEDVNITFQALEAGAVAFVEKPVGLGHPDFDRIIKKLVEMVKLMSEVKVVRRWTTAGQTAPAEAAPPPGEMPSLSEVDAVAIGASTGGPPVIQTILAGLPKNFPAPILIVQHIAAGFLTGLSEWLEHTTGFPIRIAGEGERPRPGHVYLAPDDFNMGLSPRRRIVLSREESPGSLRPSVGHLFRSVAAVCGSRSVGVLLTGMGRDGAEELKLMKERGALTIAQDRESSVVHGMPGEAIKLGAASYVLPPERIAGLLAGCAKAGEERHGAMKNPAG